MIHSRTHNYDFLIRRWRRLAPAAGLKIRPYASGGGYPLYYLTASGLHENGPAIYFSAGIHGDESAATEGLLAWAEKNTALLRRLRVMIFPCLNPWGLVNNSRHDDAGRDLNRCYNRSRVPQIRAQLKILGKARFDLALTLHEDYDANGVYIYEVAGKRPHWAEDLLRAAQSHLPNDTRRSIEGRPAKQGIVRRKISPDMMPDWPEAFILHFAHAARTFTIETPSESAIDARVAAHGAILDEAVKKCLAEFQG